MHNCIIYNIHKICKIKRLRVCYRKLEKGTKSVLYKTNQSNMKICCGSFENYFLELCCDNFILVFFELPTSLFLYIADYYYS